jgi:hypothetical protein
MAPGDFHAVATTARLATAAARDVSARRAFKSALQLETMAGKGDLQAAKNASVSLEREAERLQILLSAFVISEGFPQR